MGAATANPPVVVGQTRVQQSIPVVRNPEADGDGEQEGGGLESVEKLREFAPVGSSSSGVEDDVSSGEGEREVATQQGWFRFISFGRGGNSNGKVTESAGSSGS